MKAYDLRPLSFTADTTATNQGTQVPATDMIRKIVRMLIQNIHSTANRLTLYERISSTDTTIFDIQLDPGAVMEFKSEDMEESPPVLVLRPGSYLRSDTDNGDYLVSLWYADEEGGA